MAAASATVSVKTAAMSAVPADPAAMSAVLAAVRTEPAVMPAACRRYDQVAVINAGRA